MKQLALVKQLVVLLSVMFGTAAPASAQPWQRVHQYDCDGCASGYAGLSMIDSLRGVAVGGPGMAISVTDDGWTTQRGESLTRFGDYLQDVHFLTDQVGFAVGSSSSVYQTLDAGATWREVELDLMGGRFYDVTFVSDSTGFIAGSSGMLLKTTDRGATWAKNEEIGRRYESTVAFQAFHFPGAGNIGWAVGLGPTVIKTDDGGTRWHEQALPDSLDGVAMDVHFFDASRGLVVGGAYGARFSEEGFVLHTDDGGASWDVVTDSLRFRPNAIDFVSATHGCAVGTTGAIACTTDGGRHWRREESPAEIQLWDVRLQGTTGWAVGEAGTVLKRD